MNTLLVIVAVASGCFLVHAAPPGDNDCPTARTKGKHDFANITVVRGETTNGYLEFKTKDGEKIRVAFLLNKNPRPKFTMIGLQVKFTNVQNAKVLFLLDNNFDNCPYKEFESDGKSEQVYSFDDLPEDILHKIAIRANCSSTIQNNKVCSFKIQQMNVCEEEESASV